MNCAACGKEIGPGRNDRFAPQDSGAKECDTEVRDMCRQMDEEARERADEDNYERYR
jgi:hypothetical protein